MDVTATVLTSGGNASICHQHVGKCGSCIAIHRARNKTRHRKFRNSVVLANGFQIHDKPTSAALTGGANSCENGGKPAVSRNMSAAIKPAGRDIWQAIAKVEASSGVQKFQHHETSKPQSSNETMFAHDAEFTETKRWNFCNFPLSTNS